MVRMSEGKIYCKEVKKGIHKGGDVFRLEPNDMSLIKLNPGYEDVFKRAGCLNFF